MTHNRRGKNVLRCALFQNEFREFLLAAERSPGQNCPALGVHRIDLLRIPQQARLDFLEIPQFSRFVDLRAPECSTPSCDKHGEDRARFMDTKEINSVDA